MRLVQPSQRGLSPVLAHFQQRAANYSRASEIGLWTWQRRRELAALAALAGEVKGATVLDLGCGAGFYAIRFADAGASSVVAVDASPAMISAITDDRIETVLGDAASVALDRSFQLIVLAGLLEFVCDPIAVLVNARQHLETGGRIVALVPSDNFAGRLYRAFHRNHGFTIDLFSRPRFAQVAERAQLVILQSQVVLPFGDVHVMAVR